MSLHRLVLADPRASHALRAREAARGRPNRDALAASVRRVIEGRRAFLSWLAAAPLVACGADAGDREIEAPGGGTDLPPGVAENEYHADAGARAEGGTVGDGEAGDAGVCRATTRDAEGPYHAPGSPSRITIAAPDEPGARVVVEGRLLGPDCRTPLVGYALDIWQADAEGRYHDAAQTEYRLRGKVVSDALGRYRFETILPGRYGDAAGIRPAHLHAMVLTPGGNRLLTTQLYFAGDPYLGQADYCTRQGTCNSGDPARILALEDMPATAAKRARFDAVLART